MNCHCGKPLHYASPESEGIMNRLVEVCGEYVKVTVGDRTWRVQRHFIALHGIKAEEIDQLGFEEITNGR